MGGEGLTYDDIKSGIQAFSYNVETFEQHEKLSQIIRENFIYPDGISGYRKYYLSMKSYFNFTDYLEINELGNHQKYVS